MCNVEWCSNKPVISGKGYCRMHYDQIRKYGTTTSFRPKGNRNEYYNKGDYTELHILDEDGNTKTISLIDNDVVDELKGIHLVMRMGNILRQQKMKKLYIFIK